MRGSRNILKTLTGVGLATLLCKALAALQQLLLARTLGATEMADAYFLAQVLPVLGGGLLYNAISSNVVYLLATIPSAEERGSFLSGILLQVAGAMVLGAFIVWLVGRHIAETAWGEQPASLIQTTLKIQLALLPVLVLQPLSGVLAGALQSTGHIAASPLAMTLPYLSGLVALTLTLDGSPYPLAVGLALGSSLQILSLLGTFRAKGLHLATPLFGYGKRLISIGLPALGCQAISTLYLVSDRSFAATFGPGQVAAISYVYSLVTMPTQILVNTVVGVSLPKWVQLVGRPEQFAESVSKTLAVLCLMVIPIGLCLGLASIPLTDITLGSTKFTVAQKSATAALLASFAVTSLGFAAKDTLSAAIVSQGNPGLAFGVGIVGVATALATRPLLIPMLGIDAAAAATMLGLLLSISGLMLITPTGSFLRQFWQCGRAILIPAVPATALGCCTASPVLGTAIAISFYLLGVFTLGSSHLTIRRLRESLEG